MISKKSLKDLYVQGEVFEFGDMDNKASVYFKKLNSFESDQAFKQANILRAQILSKKFLDDDSPDKLEYFSEVYELGKEKNDLIELLIADEIAEVYAKCEQRVSENDKWKEDDRLQALFDGWKDKLSDEYQLEKSEESVKVFEQLQEFAGEVEKAVDGELKIMRSDLRKKTLTSLQRDLVDKLIDIEANRTWVIEYNKWEVHLAARDPEDHSVKLFDRSDIDEMSDEFFTLLLNAYKSLQVDDVSLKS